MQLTKSEQLSTATMETIARLLSIRASDPMFLYHVWAISVLSKDWRMKQLHASYFPLLCCLLQIPEDKWDIVKKQMLTLISKSSRSSQPKIFGAAPAAPVQKQRQSPGQLQVKLCSYKSQ